MPAFDSFVVFAGMRTGSNMLEASLNSLQDVSCYGEAFNPHFVGYPDASDILGFDAAARDRDPLALLQRIRSAPGLTGFRYFHDHDPRVLDAIVNDPTCAKIVLTRNPAESYVSWKIARATGQWKLTDVRRRKTASVVFDAAEFADFQDAVTGFRSRLMHRLQSMGQTAFHVDYSDLRDVGVINGLAVFLGSDARVDKPGGTLKVQNPMSLSSKVTNFEEMERALSGQDVYQLARLPDFEPTRAPAVPTYIAAPETPLLFLPIKGGPTDVVRAWLADLDGAGDDDLQTQMSQKTLRQWKRKSPGHRSFTVLRHPVARAHHTFCSFILGTGPQVYTAIRRTLINRYELPLPDTTPGKDYSLAQHHAAFAAFLKFLRANLAGQTAIRTDAAWCSQSHVVQGFGGLALPDFIFREDEIATALPDLAGRLGCKTAAEVPQASEDQPWSLSAIYDDEIEQLAAEAYARDYMTFGFSAWRQAACSASLDVRIV
ncbi:nodulation protein NodH [uncultured Roseobacter sp.]|uniref:nodulation protein NodH n=1 Tax=uncultured Roseobacter sp. TaxID=114847 RepID=UPI00260B2C31|nr:nodulation protein NodH [uncultured Roseobacter sp.]